MTDRELHPFKQRPKVSQDINATTWDSTALTAGTKAILVYPSADMHIVVDENATNTDTTNKGVVYAAELTQIIETLREGKALYVHALNLSAALAKLHYTELHNE